ncbi:MAG: PEP-CTERM sorting domain-containing protein, partial [Akkermansiaceae bacterium]|nr:PEP-CTERM sorting domain-containing protein [Akkermansiaceae bacterium]
AVAGDDPNNLYKTGMGNDVRGGIMRSGEPGSYAYTVTTDMGDKPVIWVNWFD